jgi:hypothetical protein
MSLFEPPQIFNSRWNFSFEAIDNTLDYIFDKMVHPCYLIGIKQHNVFFYKLTPQGNTSTLLKNKLINSLEHLDENPFLTSSQKNEITKNIDIEHSRLMQCIIKPFRPSEESDKTNKDNVYNILLKKISKSLNDGVFIFNLTDSIILRNDGMEAYDMVFGNTPMQDERFKTGYFLPIFGQGQINYMDIPIPNYDDIERIIHPTLDYADKNYDKLFERNWKNKKNKAVFRGGSSGCGATQETNMRYKLSILSKSNDFKHLLDSCIVSQRDNHIKFDPVYGLTKIKIEDIDQARCHDNKRMSMYDQSLFKFIIHIDGNVNAYRLLNTMLTGSLILRVKSEYLHWADHILKPNKHFIEIDSDLSNLKDVLEWCLNNDQECKHIAKRGTHLAEQLIQPKFIYNIFKNYLNHPWNEEIQTTQHPSNKSITSSKTAEMFGGFQNIPIHSQLNYKSISNKAIAKQIIVSILK